MMVLRKRQFLIALILVIFGLVPQSGRAQVDFEIIPEEPEYIFGERITFRAALQIAESVDQVLLYLQASEESDIQVFPVTFDSFGSLSIDIDLMESPLPGFSDIQYWYQIDLINGETYQSPVYSFSYTDNRFQWRTLSGAPFTIYWYTGDLAYGKEVLNVALEGVRKVQEQLEVYIPANLDIYVYDNAQAMQTALPAAGQEWIAGHADPVQDVILVSLPPGPDQRLEMERQIPHELMHVALDYTDSHAYSNFPVWFNEGLASLVELYPNSEYPVLIENAYESGQLIPLVSLCQSFPSDPQRTLLAYAQSASFTQYLYDQFGKPGFNRMMAAYASGLNCERGIEEALGSSLSSLEEDWQRTSFTGVTLGLAFQELLPWLILLMVVLAGPLILAWVVIRRRPARDGL